MKKFPICIQHDSMDCGAACIKMISSYYGQQLSLNYIKDICTPSREGVSLSKISTTLEQIGFSTIGGRLSLDRLIEKAPLPCILYWNQEHYVILYRIKKTKKGSFFYIADPGIGCLKYNQENFTANWYATNTTNCDKGIALVIEKKANFKSIITKEKEEDIDFKILWPYFLKYKKYFCQLFIGLLIGSIIQLFFPFLTKSIVDIGIEEKDLNFITIVLIAQLALLIGKMCAGFIENWILLHIGTRVNISMLSDFLSKLMRLPISFFDSKLTGDILQRFEDHKRIESFVTNQLLTILYAFMNILIFGGILYWFNTSIFIIFAVGSFAYICWLLAFMRKRKILDYRLFEQRAINDNKTYQLIQGMQEIKLQGCAQRMRWEWEDIQAKLFEINIANLKLKQAQRTGSVFINEVKDIIITFISAYAVINSDLTLGVMLAIQYIIGQLNLPIEQIAQFVYNMQDTKISMERIADIKQKKDENANRKDIAITESKNISIKNVSFRYNGSIQDVLKNINIDIPQKSSIAIVGASGSGKTTLIKLLLQYYKVKNGCIKIGEQNIDEINTETWRQHCGVVMQDGYIFSDTIAKNIAVSDDNINESRLLYAMKIANLEGFIDSLPLKLNTIIGIEGRGLSQGQKQRILIARAVYKMPQYLFLDEATNALDATNEKIITNNLNGFIKERTVIIVAHRLSTVMNADRILVLHNGEIIESGKHSELVNLKGYYYNLIKNQLELGN